MSVARVGTDEIRSREERDVDIAMDTAPGRAAVVKLKGRLDLVSAGQVRQHLAEAVKAGHSKQVIDLAEVSFIDSSGLGALISGLKAARLAGGDMRIARPNDQAKVILQLTTLDRVLRPYTTTDDALAGF